MILRSLQPRFARHLMGFPHTDFGYLVYALYSIEEGIAKGLWHVSSLSNSNGKMPSGGQGPGDVGTNSSIRLRPPKHYQTIGQTSGGSYPQLYVQYRSPALSRSMTSTYLHPASEPVFAA